jgi:hypothetical protein
MKDLIKLLPVPTKRLSLLKIAKPPKQMISNSLKKKKCC